MYHSCTLRGYRTAKAVQTVDEGATHSPQYLEPVRMLGKAYGPLLVRRFPDVECTTALTKAPTLSIQQS